MSDFSIKHSVKAIFFLLLVSLLYKSAICQDTIVQTNGTRMVVSVIEVGTSEIKYKKYETRQTSPIYDIEKYKVSMIKYADGTKDVFPVVTPPEPVQQLVYPGYPYDYSTPTNITSAYVNIGAMV